MDFHIRRGEMFEHGQLRLLHDNIMRFRRAFGLQYNCGIFPEPEANSPDNIPNQTVPATNPASAE